MWSLNIGSNLLDSEVNFRVWAPAHKSLALALYNDAGRRDFFMDKEDRGYFSVTVKADVGDIYFFVFDNREVPDPASRFQPNGVNGGSMVVSPSFDWDDKEWKGIEEAVIYELHVGAFGEDFDGVSSKMDYLKDLGVTAVELMPVSQYSGCRNWGYDGVFLYAVQNTYGGPIGLKKLVNEAHRKGIGVILDVVYNHVGLEGNHLYLFGPYFSSRYKTPWGPIFNYDEAWCDEVRHYVVQNALYWLYEYHVDGLRLDAVHSIFDISPRHILEEISGEVKKASEVLGKRTLLIAESDLNDPKIVRSKACCGFGIDAQWSDDLHHSLHAYLTGERGSYYEDFGTLDQIVKALTQVFVYDGVYSSYRKRTHGAPVEDINGEKFVVYSQNHDQVGNRPDGLRLISLVGEEKAKIAAVLSILSPYTPMLFMGEEYGETSPFLFFTDFSDPEIIHGLREGKQKELGDKFYDPQDKAVFEKSRLSWRVRGDVLQFYKELIKLRNNVFKDHRRNIVVTRQAETLIVNKTRHMVLAVFDDSYVEIEANWRLLLATNNAFPQTLSRGKTFLRQGAAVYEKLG
jgi:maltooligosyltrehalose trehalohydrolase